jgi:hypothetical protein
MGGNKNPNTASAKDATNVSYSAEASVHPNSAPSPTIVPATSSTSASTRPGAPDGKSEFNNYASLPRSKKTDRTVKTHPVKDSIGTSQPAVQATVSGFNTHDEDFPDFAATEDFTSDSKEEVEGRGVRQSRLQRQKQGLETRRPVNEGLHHRREHHN